MKSKLLLTAVLVLSLAEFGCMSSRVRLSNEFNPSKPADYVDYMDYYFGGLAGHPELNLQKICVDQKPLGVEQAKYPADWIITLVTLGIYSPETVRVWCGD